MIRELIRDRWLKRQLLSKISERLGGHPIGFFDYLAGGSAKRIKRRELT